MIQFKEFNDFSEALRKESETKNQIQVFSDDNVVSVVSTGWMHRNNLLIALRTSSIRQA